MMANIDMAIWSDDTQIVSISVEAGCSLSSVAHDDTLFGDGTADTPLGIEPTIIEQIENNTTNIATVRTELNEEADARESADNDIKTQISTLAQDVSATYATKTAVNALTASVENIDAVVPETANAGNKLTTSDFVNSSINNMAAFYITNSDGDAFATRAALIAGPWYFRGELRVPTTNDYALVTADETHDDKTSRFMYDGAQWVWQYTLNNTTFTQAQIDAINSGASAALLSEMNESINDKLPLSGGTLSGQLLFNQDITAASAVNWQIVFRSPVASAGSAHIYSMRSGALFIGSSSRQVFIGDPLPEGSFSTLGAQAYRWYNAYVKSLNNGADIAVPTTGGTMALKSDVDALIDDTSVAAKTTWSSEKLNSAIGDIETLLASI